jgi:hypothetical protein
MDTISKHVVLLLLACVFVLSSCSKQVAPNYEIVSIRGVYWACNVNSSYANFCSLAESELDPEVVLAVSDGDLLYLANEDDQEFYYRYSRRDGKKLVVTFDTLNTNTASLNGDLKSLVLSDHQDSWTLLQELTDPQRKQLSTLHITGELNENRLAILQLLESSLKGKGLLLEAACDQKLLGELLSICRPDWLMTEEALNFPEPDKCLALSHVELLWIEAEHLGNPELFAHCSNLEALLISGWKPEQKELLSLSGLSSLHTLTIAESSITDLAHLEFPSSLRRLHLIDCDTLRTINNIQNIRHLKGISFSHCPQIQGLMQVAELTSVKYLGFPENVSPTEFERILAKLKGLEAIELLGCEQIETISPLQNLDALKILHVDLPREKLSELEQLAGLELLILASEHFEEDPQWIGQLRSSLPSTRVVPGSGLCLGSGWILLLLPLVWLCSFLMKRILPPSKNSSRTL